MSEEHQGGDIFKLTEREKKVIYNIDTVSDSERVRVRERERGRRRQRQRERERERCCEWRIIKRPFSGLDTY
jgi:hypothetical protein